MEVHLTPTPQILRGLDRIASYLHISRHTACRWMAEHSMPAMKSPAVTYMTSTSLIDLWILARSRLKISQESSDTLEARHQ